MPVTLLLCEGGDHSPDIRVFGKLLAGICTISPHGGKYGMGDRVITRRKDLQRNSICGILDGDFTNEWSGQRNEPVEWRSNDGAIFFGWRWERKEIENYLIDPIIVERVFPRSLLNIDAYLGALESARNQIACYQAARTALSTHRVRVKPLCNYFGRPRGRKNHPFPNVFDESHCQSEIRSVVSQYSYSQSVGADAVIASYQIYLNECLSGGSRSNAFLSTFAGKDIVWALEPWLSSNGFSGPEAFIERIVVGIERSIDDISSWLPEWARLKWLIQNTSL